MDGKSFVKYLRSNEDHNGFFMISEVAFSFYTIFGFMKYVLTYSYVRNTHSKLQKYESEISIARKTNFIKSK